MRATRAHFILYVADQAAAARFYCRALGLTPSLDVPGMTEFDLGGRASVRTIAFEPLPRDQGSHARRERKVPQLIVAELFKGIHECRRG